MTSTTLHSYLQQLWVRQGEKEEVEELQGCWTEDWPHVKAKTVFKLDENCKKLVQYVGIVYHTAFESEFIATPAGNNGSRVDNLNPLDQKHATRSHLAGTSTPFSPVFSLRIASGYAFRFQI